jgi:hypothetical protein
MRQDPARVSIDSETRKILDRDANTFARKFKVDADRVRAVFERMVAQFAGATPTSLLGRDPRDRVRSLHIPRLSTATNCLGPDAALTLFEQADLGDLTRRLTAMSYLISEPAFLTLEELADQVEAAADQLSLNRTALIATGLPVTSFGFGWLWQMLTYVYPIKMFNGLEMTRIKDGTQQLANPIGIHRLEYQCSYSWVCRRSSATSPSRASRSSTRTRKRRLSIPCTYDEAPLIKGLDETSATRLEAGRAAFIDVEIQVLRQLAAALRAQDATNLWRDCLQMITDTILASDAAFYLEIDRLYTSDDILTGQSVGSGNAWVLQGGLSNLFRLIGHCEKELTIGTLARTRRALPAQITDRGELYRQSSPYYRAVGQPWQAQLDRALDQYWALEAHEATFWDTYRIRVNEALENEFYAEVVTRTRVKQKLVAEFEPLVRGFAEAQRAYQEATGALLPIHLTAPPQPAIAPKNRFQRAGNVWNLEFDGHTIYLPDSKGLQYLGWLVRHPNVEFNALELVLAIAPTADGSQEHSGSSTDALRDGSLSVRLGTGDAGPILDQTAKNEYKRLLNDIEEEIAEAKMIGNIDRIEELHTQRDWVLGQLSTAVGLGGRDRIASSDVERARTSVTNAIRRAEKSIEKAHPALAAHLRYIKKGRFFSYDPPHHAVPTWEF